MTRFLAATASVHTTATVCDYLQGRITADDTVFVVGVTETETGTEMDTDAEANARDVGDATNVARTRLVKPTVELITRDGNPSEIIQNLVAEHDIDEVIIGSRRGSPDATPGLGGTAADLLVSLDVPVIVVPQPDT